MADNDFMPVIEAMKRFVRDTERDGKKVVAWPLNDPTFQIEGIDSHGGYVLVSGTDARGRESMMVVPIPQFSMQISCEDKDAAKKSFGFIKPTDAAK